jgi:hypothetical protein
MWVLAVFVAFAAPPCALRAEPTVDFKEKILPIFKESCFECHGATKQKGKLRLDQREAARKGGKSGSSIVPGKADESEIYKRILLPKSHDERMPNEGEPLSKTQTDLIRDWINQGAVWPEESKDLAATGTPKTKRGKTDLEVSEADLLPPDRSLPEVIDHYIEAKLARAGVVAAPQVDDATLVRRLTLDLAGRIPPREDAEAYVASKDPQKRGQWVERLMATPWFWRHAATELNAILRGIDSRNVARETVWPRGCGAENQVGPNEEGRPDVYQRHRGRGASIQCPRSDQGDAGREQADRRREEEFREDQGVSA